MEAKYLNKVNHIKTAYHPVFQYNARVVHKYYRFSLSR